MDSALEPREIQQRVRAGQSVDEVAAAAGVPVDKIAPFTDPVMVERNYVAQTALVSSLRLRWNNFTPSNLRSAVNKHLLEAGVSLDAVRWDAIRFDNRHEWTVIARWSADGKDRQARFHYDVPGRFCVPQNDDAHELVDDVEAPAGQFGDDEPTVNFAEQFAIVDAVSEDPPLPTDGATSSGENLGPVDLRDFVPSPESELDNLYAMLHGFEEDSVNVYAGLSEPPSPDDVRRGVMPPPAADVAWTDPPFEATHSPTPGIEPEPVAPSQRPAPSEPDEPEPEPEQPSLIEEEPAVKPRKKRRRASVPSWDEIMFGGPKDRS